MSLLLDALKQAEKSKQEKAGASGHQQPVGAAGPAPEDGAAVEHPPLDETIDLQDRGDELSMEPLDGLAGGNGVTGFKDRDTVELGPTTEGYSGELRLSPQESQSLSIDLGRFADELSQATGPVKAPPVDQEGAETASQGVVGEGSITMPSIKNVQRSLNDFYGESTGVMSSPEAMLPEEAPAVSEPPETEKTGARTEPSQHTAQTVFDAKHGGKSGNTLWLALTAVVIALLLGGGFFLYDIFSVDPIAPRVARAPLPAVTPSPGMETPLVEESSRAASPAQTPAQAQAELDLAAPVAELVAAVPGEMAVAAPAEPEVAVTGPRPATAAHRRHGDRWWCGCPSMSRGPRRRRRRKSPGRSR